VDAALGWIGDLVSWLVSWLPHLVQVRKTERAVKFIRGKTAEIGPGLHLWWPITTEVEVRPVVRQVMGLGSQTLTTKDGQAVHVDGLLVYSIGDLHTYLVENWEAEDSLGEVGQAGIRKAVVNMDFDDIQRGMADVDNRLTKEAQKLLERFGVEVELMRLTSFSRAHVLNLVGDMTHPLGEGD
jgi:regulator of protease activity HflC (stomatin/prohibitin superfamily)